jgi:hypothetical protein
VFLNATVNGAMVLELASPRVLSAWWTLDSYPAGPPPTVMNYDSLQVQLAVLRWVPVVYVLNEDVLVPRATGVVRTSYQRHVHVHSERVHRMLAAPSWLQHIDQGHRWLRLGSTLATDCHAFVAVWSRSVLLSLPLLYPLLSSHLVSCP